MTLNTRKTSRAKTPQLMLEIGNLIVNDLITGGAQSPLSAEAGKVLYQNLIETQSTMGDIDTALTTILGV
jgi:hypothetical protein